MDTSLLQVALLSSLSSFMVSGGLFLNTFEACLTYILSFLGFVYDISTGKIYDMDVSQGPPGYKGDYSKCKRNLLDSLRRGDADPSKVEGC